MKLPLLLSVPHAGLRVPDEVRGYCRLSADEIREDGDEGAAEIYALADHVQRFETTDIARAIVDLNRAPDDRRADGVVKTHTCWQVPVYEPTPPETLFADLLERHYHPYHARLSGHAGHVPIGIDCHTMAASGPPIGPDPGAERPWLCLSNGDGTCPDAWLASLATCLEAAFEHPVARNDPFQGGYITRSHAAEMPWMQLEFSRAPFLSNPEKRTRLLAGLRDWVQRQGWDPG